MQAELRSYITERHISGTLCERLESLDSNSAAAVCQLLREVAPSANTLREYLRLLDEVALRDQSTIATLLGDRHLSDTLAEVGISRKEKQKKVRTHLERLRYPELSAIADRLEGCTKSLLQKTGVRVELPQDYEGDKVQVTLSARSPSEFVELAAKLSALAAEEQCSELFAILRGEV